MRDTAALLVLVLLCASAAAEDISVRKTAEAFYADESVGVFVEIGEVDETVTALTLRVPDGFTATGPSQRGRRSTFVNGVSRSWTEFLFRVEAPADASGVYPLGPLVVTYRSGRTREIAVGEVRVGPRPGGGIRFRVEAEPPTGPIALPFTVTYRVLYSGELAESRDAFGEPRTPFGLTDLDLAVLDRADLTVESIEPPGGEQVRGIRIGRDRVLYIRSGHLEEEGTLYRALSFAFRVTPLAAEDIDLSGRVGISLVDGTERRRDMFGRTVNVPKRREARAETGAAIYRVQPLPEEGRPRGFSGAVGRYTIEAVPAATEVNAFDPIEVTVTVRGRGVLERVALPRWSEFPEIAREFELSTDVDPGRMEGAAKVFRVTFRARSSAVTRLPGLPFPHYDPWKGEYAVASSAPVPLEVRDVKTVRAEEGVGAASGPAPAADAPTRLLGIGANFETLDEGERGLQEQPPLYSMAFVLLLVLPPVLAGAWVILERRRSRPRDLPRGTPLSRALEGLRAGGADGAAEAFAAYFRERLDLGPGEVTPRELERALTARVVPAEITGRVVGAHEALVAARFAGGEAPGGLEELVREVDRCLE